MRRLLAAVAAVAVAVFAIAALRRATMTVHERMDPESHMSVEARARWRAGSEGVRMRSWALAQGCVAETNAQARAAGFRWRADGAFRFVVSPAFDAADRHQLRGCLSDFRISGLLVDVGEMRFQTQVPA